MIVPTALTLHYTLSNIHLACPQAIDGRWGRYTVFSALQDASPPCYLPVEIRHLITFHAAVVHPIMGPCPRSKGEGTRFRGA
jgi:hypothetical protein